MKFTVAQLKYIMQTLRIAMPEDGSGAKGNLIKEDFGRAVLNHLLLSQPIAKFKCFL